MNTHVGPLRTREGLQKALAHISQLSEPCRELPSPQGAFDAAWLDLHDLRNMRLVAECITRAALGREESRGAHQREDFPEAGEAWQRHQRIRFSNGRLEIAS